MSALIYIFLTFVCLLLRDKQSHKRFSQYFDNTKETNSEASDSDSSASAISDDGKTSRKNNRKPVASSAESSKSDTEDENDDGLILMPAFKTIPEDKQAFIQAFSDSEPEDPEEVRKLQERLLLRRSRVHNTTTVSTKNRTLQHNRTTSNTSKHSDLNTLKICCIGFY